MGKKKMDFGFLPILLGGFWNSARVREKPKAEIEGSRIWVGISGRRKKNRFAEINHPANPISAAGSAAVLEMIRKWRVPV